MAGTALIEITVSGGGCSATLVGTISGGGTTHGIAICSGGQIYASQLIEVLSEGMANLSLQTETVFHIFVSP